MQIDSIHTPSKQRARERRPSQQALLSIPHPKKHSKRKGGRVCHFSTSNGNPRHPNTTKSSKSIKIEQQPPFGQDKTKQVRQKGACLRVCTSCNNYFTTPPLFFVCKTSKLLLLRQLLQRKYSSLIRVLQKSPLLVCMQHTTKTCARYNVLDLSQAPQPSTTTG
ncbi:unnamed protein product [Ectocarpus sp. 8 AP-2014]